MFRLPCVSLLELVVTLYFIQGILLTNTKIYANSSNSTSDFQEVNNTYPPKNSTRNSYAQDRKLKFFKVFKKAAKFGPKQKKTFKFITKKLPQIYQQFTQPIHQPAPPVKYKQKRKKAPIQCIPIEYLQHLRPQQGNIYKDYEHVYDDEDDEDYSAGTSGNGHFVPLQIPIPGLQIFHPYRRISTENGRKRRFWRTQPTPTPTVPQVIHTLIKGASIPPKIYGFLKLVNSGRDAVSPKPRYPGNHQDEDKFKTPNRYSPTHYYSSKYRNESLLDYNTTQRYVSSNPIFFGINKGLNNPQPAEVVKSGQQIIAYNKNYVNVLNQAIPPSIDNLNANQHFGLRNVTVPKVLFSPATTEAYVEKWRAVPKYHPNIYFTDIFLPGNVSVGSYEVNEDFMETDTQPQFLLKPKIRN